jgi:Heparinase II/III-like protein/Heparinase II/III N-terminus
MRSPAEIAFRLRQEASNATLFLLPPRRAPEISSLPLPDPELVAERLRGTAFATDLVERAEKILAHRIPLLGYDLSFDREIPWRRDCVHQRQSSLAYFRLVPYLDFSQAGDHKIIWELNRHQHLVLLAQASVLTGRADFLDELYSQLDSWMADNPLCRGINWAGALEVAFRALSWIWIHHLAGKRMPAHLEKQWRLSLYHHGCFLERNLSIYFSPNTHLQGEALALHALGLVFGIERWRNRGRALMNHMIQTHVEADGGHFEKSSYYHVYSLDMFLFHAVLEPPEQSYLDSVRRMARYLWSIAGTDEMPFFGDDDGGRLFYPYGDRSRFARATLAACAVFPGDTPSHADSRDLNELAVWWLPNAVLAGPPAVRFSEQFPQTGLVTMAHGDVELIASVRAFARGSAGHSHAHSLHFTLRRAGQQVLTDPGTYTYVGDPAWRDRFRGTAAHNTVRIDQRDQADPAGSFRWTNPPQTEVIQWQANPWRLHARCHYRGISHERRIFFESDALWIIDDIMGSGRHRIEQFWHPAGAVDRKADGSILFPSGVRLLVPDTQLIDIQDGGEYGWHSPVFGIKNPLPVVRQSIETELPGRLVAVFDFRAEPALLTIESDQLLLGGRKLQLR